MIRAAARVGRKGKVAGFLRRVESAPHECEAVAQVPRPGNDVRETEVDPGLETEQPALLHQIDGKLAEAKPRRVIAEPRAEEHADPAIGEARSVTVAMLEAEIRHATDDETMQIVVGEQGRRHDFREHLDGRAPSRIAHLRQVDECLDRPAPELLPNPLNIPVRTSSSVGCGDQVTPMWRRNSRPISTARSGRSRVV